MAKKEQSFKLDVSIMNIKESQAEYIYVHTNLIFILLVPMEQL